MMHVFSALVLIFSFFTLARVLRILENSRQALIVAQRAFNTMYDTELTDEAKERSLQADAKQLFLLFFRILIGSIAALLLPLVPLWMFQQLGLISLSSVLTVAFSPTFVILLFSFTLILWILFSKKWAVSTSYSLVDKWLHRIAFNTSYAQVSFADLEDRVFAKQLHQCRADRPVFITSLPRSGTTMLLQCLTRSPEFASHCYRDIPFVLIPCFWSCFSKRFHENARPRERAHADGVLINPDSPEAMEEILWKFFWRDRYLNDRILPWGDNQNREFNDFFSRHMRKIILLRSQPGVKNVRYISKNNNNIARIATLQDLFPDAVAIIPFRKPVQHAASLLKQHRNFLRIHREDRFAANYMEAIGHYDFGENLRPIDFNGWLDQCGSETANELVFWLEYWLACYKHLIAENPNFVIFISYEDLCTNPFHGIDLVGDAIGAQNSESFLSNAKIIRPANERLVDTDGIPKALLQEAEYVYHRLKRAALA